VSRLVIVGASLAGLRAAQGARNAGHEGELVVVGEELHRPYTRPPLSKELLTTAEHTVDDHLFPSGDLDVHWRLGECATALDPQAHTVTLGDHALDYDRLIVATGCRARPWSGPGAELDGVHTIREVGDAIALRDALTSGSPRLLIVGAGFIGCEVAASARTLGIDVTLCDVAPLPMPALGDLVGERTAALQRAHGVDLRLGQGITALVGDGAGRVAGVQLADGSRLEADVVLVALGAIPNVDWLASSGLTVDGGLVCDATLTAVGAPDVLAAGDVVAWPHPLGGEHPIRVEHWTNAAEQGTLAGRNATAAPADRAAYTAVPSFWSDQYDVKIQAVGLPRRAAGWRIVEATPDGDRWMAVGERDGRVVAAVAFNGARRLMVYRRAVGEATPVDELVAAVAADEKAFGSPTGAAA
jgi:NADPH-dependent 2,4-dienoyl-CoA reductase/sulfur reductase-like enzyme